MIGGQFRINFLGSLSKVERVIAAVVFGQLLLDDVGLDCDSEMVCLSGQVGGAVIIGFLCLEASIAQVAPQHREHPEFVRSRKRLGYFLKLPFRLFGSEVDRSSDARAALFVGLIDRAENNLIETIRIREKLVVIEL